jgi:hypothetical protein
MIPSDVPSMIPRENPTAVSSQNQTSQCYSNLTLIANIEMSISDLTTPRSYILCPETDYDIGSFDDNGEFQGQSPILPRSNVVYMCGDDGLSSNKCTLRGGSVQLITIGSDEIVNVMIAGLTFEGAGSRGLVLDLPGDILFVDCAIQVSRRCNKGVLVSVAYNFPC